MNMLPANDGFDVRHANAAASARDVADDVVRKRAIAAALYPFDDADLALMKFEYRLEMGLELDLQSPRDIAAKLQWLKRHDRNPLYRRLVDKFEVRAYVAEHVGAELLTHCFGVYEAPTEIVRSDLPDKFVLKATHGWNMNIVCKDMSKLDWPAVLELAGHWLTVRHELRHGEWAYSQVPPRLIVEALLDDGCGDLIDYKFFCFNGVPRFIKIDRGRSTGRFQTYLSLEWSPLPFRNPNAQPMEPIPAAPRRLAVMIDAARRLSSGLSFVRVDLYNCDGEIRFGELTLYPCGGNLRFEPREWSYRVGDMLVLPAIQ